MRFPQTSASRQSEALAEAEMELTASTLSYFSQPPQWIAGFDLSAQLTGDAAPFRFEAHFVNGSTNLERDDGEKFKSDAERIHRDIGSDLRNRGTVQSDRTRVWPMTSSISAIAVGPSGGWWTDRKFEGDPRPALLIDHHARRKRRRPWVFYTPILNKSAS